MSKRHPVVAVTGSSGAGTSTVKRAFEHIFAREDIVPAVVEGDSYHRFERMPMKKAMADALSKGEIFIQESKVEYEKIIAKVLAVSKNRTDTRIYVRGDKTINYGRVLEIMGLLSGSGFTKVALISEPYKER